MDKKITITINENGSMDLKTDGFKGEACVNELEEILEDLALINSLKKTDDYYQKIDVQNKNTVRR